VFGMTIRVELYEPPMCCPTGICGPSVDERLVKVMENIETLKKKYEGIEIERYMLSQYFKKFKENQDVNKILTSQGKKSLPITIVNGEVIKTGEYPSLEEIESRIAGE
jgi:hypothetical protein